MFLLCRLHLDSLAHKITPQGVLDALDRLPKGIDDAYDETMKQIYALDEEPQSLALKTIMLITYAYRPLYTKELQVALAFSSDSPIINDRSLVDETIIMDICAGLVVIDVKSQMVRLVHYTAQKHFEGYTGRPFSNAHTEITNICLGVMSLPDAQSSRVDIWNMTDRSGFSFYAARYWGRHARGPVEETNQVMIQKFLSCDQNVENALKHIFFYSGVKEATVLHLCAYHDLAQTTDNWLKSGGFVDEHNGYHRLPLHVAAFCGSQAVMKVLLDLGHGINSKDQNGMTPLLCAIAKGRSEIVELLLAKPEVDVKLADINGWTPLRHAIREGNSEIVKLLLTKPEVDVNLTDTNGWTPLLWAIGKGNSAIVEVLLANPEVDVNLGHKDGWTPLRHAIREGNSEIVKLLLAKPEVDVNLIDTNGWTPLLCAIGKGNSEIVEALLANPEVDVNLADKDGWTPFWCAVEDENKEIVKLLLAKPEVDVNLGHTDGWTPLRYTVLRGNSEIIKLLLARQGMYANSKDEHGRTPLSYAAQSHNSEIVELLLTRPEVDVNSRDQFDRTPLTYAAWSCNTEAAKLLLTRDEVNVNSRDYRGWTPLSYAAHTRNVKTVELLLSREDVIMHPHDIDICMALAFSPQAYRRELARLFLMRWASVNFHVCKDKTPLCLAAWYGDEQTVELLLACDEIDVNAIPEWGSIPPLWAAAERVLYENSQISADSSSENHHSSVVDSGNQHSDNSPGDEYHSVETEAKATMKLLLGRHDINVNWRNERGKTLLHIAATHGSEFLVEQLLSRYDIQVNPQDETGDSPLHCAVRYGQNRVTSLLVQRNNIALNLKNLSGHTPLHCAIIFVDNNEEQILQGTSSDKGDAILKILLAKDGIALGLADNNGLTPLMLARSIKTLDMLLERCAADLMLPPPGPILDGPIYRASPSQPLFRKREGSMENMEGEEEMGRLEGGKRICIEVEDNSLHHALD